MYEIVDYLMKESYEYGVFEKIESLSWVHILTFSRKNDVLSYMIEFIPGQIDVHNMNHADPHTRRVAQRLLQEIHEKLEHHPLLRLRFITGEMILEIHK